MAGLAWQIWLKAGKIYGYGDSTDVLRVPVGPFVYLMAAMVAITAIIHLIRATLATPTAPPLLPDLDIKSPS